MASHDPTRLEEGRRGRLARALADAREAASRRGWLIASLRELLHPLIVAYIVAAVALDAVRAYSHWPDLDLPMHYAGALALTYVIDRSVARAYHFHVLKPIGGWQRALAVFALVCMFSMFWEIGEYLSDRFLGTHAQMGLADTMTDMITDVVGSVSFLVARVVARRLKP
ncbi:MAG TPA: hypothetical protein VNT02_01570 [Burkholderiales bacterium]|nr:hypothetical protein [Burkholderiales bacterium]